MCREREHQFVVKVPPWILRCVCTGQNSRLIREVLFTKPTPNLSKRQAETGEAIQCSESIDIGWSKVEQYVYHKRHLAEMPGLHVRNTITTREKNSSSSSALTKLKTKAWQHFHTMQRLSCKLCQVRWALKTPWILNYIAALKIMLNLEDKRSKWIASNSTIYCNKNQHSTCTGW